MTAFSKTATREVVFGIGRAIRDVLDGLIGFSALFDVKSWMGYIMNFGFKVYDLVKRYVYQAPLICSTFMEKFLGFTCELETQEDFQILKQYHEKSIAMIRAEVMANIDSEYKLGVPLATDDRTAWIPDAEFFDYMSKTEENDENEESVIRAQLEKEICEIIFDAHAAAVAAVQKSTDGAEVTIHTPLVTVPDWSIEDCVVVQEYIEPHFDPIQTTVLKMLEGRAERREKKHDNDDDKEGPVQDRVTQVCAFRETADEIAEKIKQANMMSSTIWEARRKAAKIPRTHCLPMLRKAIVMKAKSKFYPVGNDGVDLMSARRAVEEVCRTHNLSDTFVCKFVTELPAFVATPDAAEMHAAYMFGCDAARHARFVRSLQSSH
jgi:hypothetical protein